MANLTLAGFLLDKKQIASQLLRKLTDERDSLAPRTGAFVDAVGAVLARWGDTPNRAVLNGRLRTLHARDLGGFAAVLSSLPLKPRTVSVARKAAAPSRIAEAILSAREEIVAGALDAGSSNGSPTLIADLIASGIVDRLSGWTKTADDPEIIQWAESMLDSHQNADLAAHLFGETVQVASKTLQRAGLLDDVTENALVRLRQTLDAHVSASQVRRTVETVDPVDPIDAKIEDLLHRLSARDEITFEHSRSVGAWCARLSKRMRLSRADATLVTRSGLLHDIGKVLTPPEILKAPRKLMAWEWETMKRHTLDGVRLIEPIRELHALIPAVRWHHERYDGKGYPDGIPLQDIPFAARIVSVADAFNAMIARRPYRPPMSPMAAIAQLRDASSTQFDPAVVDHMIDVVLRPDR
jgi:putative nucleotidyltransferase with HDIG domain